MREFDRQLLRLKEALGKTDDQDVASALGMTKAAFSARKTRGVFPEDKLAALAIQRPELGLDVGYVMTGRHAELERRLAAVRSATDIASRVAEPRARYEVQTAAFSALLEQLSPEEQLLVANFRHADSQGRTAILATAAAVAAASSTQGKT